MFLYYISKRILLLLLTLLIVSFIVFALVRLIPGDPVLAIAGAEATPEVIEEMRTALGLDRPILPQYVVYMKGLFRGDLGSSLKTQQMVGEDILRRLPATLELAVAGMFVSLVVGISLGILAGLRPGNWVDVSARLVSLFGVSSPTFWTGLLFVLAFGYYWRLFPIAGSGGLQHLVLPAITVSLTSMAFLTRLTRASLMEVLSEDYIRTARAKGLSPMRVVVKHALRNSLIAPLTVAGLEFGRLISGVIVIEIIFAWPGIGKLLIDSIQFRDWPVIQGLILVYAFIYAAVNTGVDLMYAVLDPRMKLNTGQR
jgi:ABC-type dipeptide/oligopeptide/nickel transport system permease component